MTKIDAQAKIAKAKEENANFLDLGDLGLTEFPDELFDLTHLEFLNLGRRYIQNHQEIRTVNQGERNILKWIPWKIRRLTNLKSLSLYATYTGDISGLKELGGLQYLDLSYTCFIRDYSTLNYFYKLQILNLGSNDMSKFTFNNKLKNLRYLDLGYNSIDNLDFLAELEKIEVLIIPDLGCTIDIALFGHLKQLKSLSVGSNILKNLDSFSALSQLEYLNLFDCKINDISALSHLKNLRKLSLWRNNIKTIDPISTLSSLNDLNLRDNSIESIDALRKLRNLNRLNVGFNRLTNQNIEREFDFVKTLKTDCNLYNRQL